MIRVPAPLAGHTVLYGGSFDPPHLGHQMACLMLVQGLGADAVWVLPTYQHPFGKRPAAFEDRLAMCQSMAAPLSPQVQVHATERELGGAGRTYDLVMHLKQQHPEVAFALAIGADIVEQTPRWHRWAELSAAVRVIVVGRAGYAAAADTPALPALASHALRAAAAAGESLVGQVPLAVAQYVAAKGLYRT